MFSGDFGTSENNHPRPGENPALMTTSNQTIERAVDELQKHPVRYLVILAILLFVGLIIIGGTITAVRYRLQDRKVEKLEKKSEEAIEQKDAAKSEADKAAGERVIEDAIRERTIKPEIERTSRNLEDARSRTKEAQTDYDKARSPKDSQGNDPDSRALHERNCSDLRELYPGETIPHCEP